MTENKTTVAKSLDEQLKALRIAGKLQNTSNAKNTNKMPPSKVMASPMDIGEDGVTHINIWDHGKTEIGKLLSHSSELSFKHDVFFNFRTMDCFWHYIRSQERDDHIRDMSPRALKEFSKKLTPVRVVNFRAIIMDANYQKVMQYPVLVSAMMESTVPFECYYTHLNSDVRIRPPFASWIMRGFEEIRKAIKFNREPDWGFITDNRHIGLFGNVLPEKMIEPTTAPVVVTPPKQKHKKPFVHRVVPAEVQEHLAKPVETDANIALPVDPLEHLSEAEIQIMAGKKMAEEDAVLYNAFLLLEAKMAKEKLAAADLVATNLLGGVSDNVTQQVV